ncbi:hypothetical protein ZIOFF_058180 [Zingiber officinale]|uniref:Uncharacterized protein n=1 Tax=Zingiber officinale TaxID=94328 RepID=A0A8J5KCW7_ZINOF|nr:hypothetical protein ZIOFF_058180 [Zingiber officinale]
MQSGPLLKKERLSIGSLGLRLPAETLKDRPGAVHAYSNCLCDIRLGDHPIQRTRVPFVSSPQDSPDANSNLIVFYLEESDVKTLTPKACLQVVVYMGKQGSHCGLTSRRQIIGRLRLEIGLERGLEKPALLHNGWVGVGKNKGERLRHGPELHLKVRMDPDPRYVLKFEDETTLSPQIVQQQGTVKQPIFSCKFVKDRRSTPLDMANTSDEDHGGAEKRERKGWKVMIHDLSGSAVAAAFMATPFVPSSGCDRVDRSNPGAWLILHPSPASSAESWHLWGRLEAWREAGPRDTICLRLHILSEGQETGILVSDVAISSDKGGEFFIDMDRRVPVNSSPAGRLEGSTQGLCSASLEAITGGFVMNCKVQGEDKCSKPLVHLAARHIACVQDAAIFIALAAAVDLSIRACRPFGRKANKGLCHALYS